MPKIRITLVLAVIFSSQITFAAQQDMSSVNKACTAIAKACLDAGYATSEFTEKRFWQDCMKPILLGKSVEKVTIDSAIGKECRDRKINEFKKELNELQKASSQKPN